MRRKLSITYAIFCTLLMVGGFLAVFYFAWKGGTGSMIACLCGLAIGFIFAPTVHELGHLCMAKSADMECVYIKFFCFKIWTKKGKKRLSFASPFAPDQTQVIPKRGGQMARRATFYTLGGLLFSGTLLVTVVATAIHFHTFVAWGALPYTAYLYLLNVLPLEYASGKTDVLVYHGIKKGWDSEKCMLAAMEIHGRLYEGSSFAEIDEGYYFRLPQLREDDPVFAMLLDLRYRYYLDKKDYEKAGGTLNRLAAIEEYLPDGELEKVAAELAYMHAVEGNLAKAAECSRLAKGYLDGGSPTALRILATCAAAEGKKEDAMALIKRAKEDLSDEKIRGLQKFEKNLLERINAVG